ncbi:hypothetical protein SCOR_15340 [Sulfidibacter corallicola]|uniref:Uncharacterized protein n=1 Tax=Sulfidibacter corallicola TaxID=2818388 RepID=A0A8A4TXU7_SULCO|nr:hypothetical protein [Sulfidibacter corallicola]QTD54157.1 hypothetical protein J3U87_17060 [Sulfidibacter corallicola]
MELFFCAASKSFLGITKRFSFHFPDIVNGFLEPCTEFWLFARLGKALAEVTSQIATNEDIADLCPDLVWGHLAGMVLQGSLRWFWLPAYLSRLETNYRREPEIGSGERQICPGNQVPSF